MMNSVFSRTFTVLLAVAISAVMLSCGGNKKSSSDQNQANASLTREQAVEQSTFVDLDGETVPISRFEGKVVLIDFWETWCKPCLASFPTMQKLMEDYPDDFVVLAVSPGWADSKEDAREFREDHDYDFVYLYDENSLHEKLNVQGIPFKVFVSSGGEFVEASMGSRGPQSDYEHAEKIIRDYRDS